MGKIGSYLVITTPNFHGIFHHLLNSLFDRKSLKRHNLPAMNPAEWENVLVQQGFEIIYQGFFGNFWFWVDESDTHSKVSKYFIKQVQRLMVVFRTFIKLNSKHYCVYAGVVA